MIAFRQWLTGAVTVAAMSAVALGTAVPGLADPFQPPPPPGIPYWPYQDPYQLPPPPDLPPPPAWDPNVPPPIVGPPVWVPQPVPYPDPGPGAQPPGPILYPIPGQQSGGPVIDGPYPPNPGSVRSDD